jgi:septum formation protein
VLKIDIYLFYFVWSFIITRLILASSSPRRIDLLKSIGIVPDLIISPDIDESHIAKEKPVDYALRMAERKMLAVKDTHKGDIIITADTVVAKGRRILPKAETLDDFNACMALLSGGKHTTMTAISVCNPEGKIKTKLVKTILKVKRLHKVEIDAFYVTNEWQSKAGGYALQGYFGQFINQISGSYSAVIGLPVCEASKLLHWAGYHAYNKTSMSADII